MKVAVVTPTIGSEHLQKCIESVDKQTYDNLTHYIFMDGIQYWRDIDNIIEGAENVKVVKLEDNVGKGWYGHRVYAACSFLVNADVICYLDEDNWYDPCHIEKLIEKMREGNEWVYSLRKIYDKSGEFLCEDNCESLGKWPVYFNSALNHIDTSSFAVKRDVATQIGHSWYGQWGADRNFFHNLAKYFPKYDCTGSHTLCYRLDGNPNSVTKAFFERGNEEYAKKYDVFPWKKIHTVKLTETEVGPGIKIVA
jgi:glycosyltransferase involved in cell wall biosynthesis